MWMLRWRRFLLGWVCFEAECAAPERLLDGCARAGIALWNVQRQGLTLRARCALSSYRALRRRRVRGDVRPHVTARKGLPFYVRRVRRRSGMAVGALLAAVLLWWMGGRVWVLDVQGNVTVPTQDILTAAAAEGVHVGMRIKDIDVQRLQLTIPGHLEGLSWATVNPDGCVAHIAVTERNTPPDILTEGQYSNLCAAADGVIVEVRAQTGLAAVRPGEAVAAGDLLVCGTVETERGPLYYRSVGQVLAQTRHTLTVRIPLNETLLLPTGRQVCRPSLCLFGLCIPLYSDPYPDTTYTTEHDRYFLYGGRYELPVGLAVETLTLTQQTAVQHTAETAREMAYAQLTAMEAEAFAKAEIVSRRADDVLKDGCIVLTAQYTVIEDIAKEVPFSAPAGCE